jgi:hypothetical protein
MDQYGEETMRLLAGPSSSCVQCRCAVGSYQCLECLHPAVLCKSCMVKEHKMRPLHRIEVSCIQVAYNFTFNNDRLLYIGMV